MSEDEAPSSPKSTRPEKNKKVDSSPRRRSPKQKTKKSRPSSHRENSSKSNSTSSLDDGLTNPKKEKSRRDDVSKESSSNRLRKSSADQDRKDRDAKRRAKRDPHPSKSSGTIGGATVAPGAESVGPSDEKAVSQRRKTREDQRSRSKNTQHDQEKRDRASKRAARSTKSPTRPGAVSSQEPGASKSKRSSTATSARSDKEAKKGGRPSRRSTRPGAQSSKQEDRAKTKVNGDGTGSTLPAFDEENEIRVHGGENNDDASEIKAELVDDNDDERTKNKNNQETNRVQQAMQDENERLRRDMEEMQVKAAADKKKKNKRNCIIVLVVLVLIGGAAGAFFALQGNSSKEIDPIGTNNNTPTVAETDSPTDLVVTTPNPSNVPSLPPTFFLKYPPPSQEDCNAVAQQLPVEGEESMPVMGYGIDMEAILSYDMLSETVISDVEAKLRSVLIPSLVGCTDLERRQLRGGGGDLPAHRKLVNSLQYAIGNGEVTVQLSGDGVCETETTQPCYRILVSLELAVRGEEKIFDIMGILLQVFQRPDLAEFLSLNEPVQILVMTKFSSTDKTDTPSVSPTGIPSFTPSTAPSSSPTTSPPTDEPSNHPTRSPAIGPTTAPVPDPTPTPTVILLTPAPTCPGVEAYFDNGSFSQHNGSQDGSHNVGCTASTDLVALTYNSDTCDVQCVGSLPSGSYSESCSESNQVRFVLPGDFQNENLLLGYRSSSNSLTCGNSMVVITDAPTQMPFPGSTPLPTITASEPPTLFPTSVPSSTPSSIPSSAPTNAPTGTPSSAPSIAPSVATPAPTSRRPYIESLLSGYALDADALTWLSTDDTWPLDESNPDLVVELLERHDLVVFYQATGGSSWTPSTNWLSSVHACAWEKVECSSSLRVTGIYTFQNNLVGSIPTEIGRLSNLLNLNLSGNSLGVSSPSLPETLSQLTQLTHLDINNSNLQGTVPPVLNELVNLNYLNLKNNNLQGTLPALPAGVKGQGCNQCFLQGNNFGNVWSALFEECLVDICISGNTGDCNSYCLPNDRRSYYEDVLLGYNVDEAALNWLADVDTFYPNPYNRGVKREVQERHDLARLYLATGGDSWTENRHWLNGAHVCGWYRVGCISYSVTQIYLYDNNLTGSIPTEIGRFTNLVNLNLGDNDFSSSSQSLPSEIGELTLLTGLKIYSSNLKGSIPDVMDRLSNLTMLKLQNNQLDGTIPQLPTGIQSPSDCTNCMLEQNNFVDIQNGIDQNCNITVCVDSECTNTCF